jgi:DNA polymerase-3 subunit alpha
MKSFMRELQPESLEDVIAGIALYRPGPMDFIPKYVKGKRNPNKVTYMHEKLKPILEATYGCIVYQEQVMQIVRDLAGFSMGRSDLMRRAMSKKKADVMEGERRIFIHGSQEDNVPGCVKNGIPAHIAEQIFNDMADFAEYAFNKPHAAGYALLSYQTAWLKHYHPVEFMAATMTSIMDQTAKVAAYIYECKKMNIALLPPDINEGHPAFSVTGNAIRFGLAAIRNVGRGAVQAIVAEREAGGKYRGITDFVSRLQGSEIVNKRCMESLIKAGAFDSLGGKRVQYMAVFPGLVSGMAQAKKSTIEGQLSLFDIGDDEKTQEYLTDDLPPLNELPKRQLLADEKEMLGIYVSGHPLSDYEETLRSFTKYTSIDFAAEAQTDNAVTDGAEITFGGQITAKSVKYTKRDGKPMCFLTIEDMYGSVEVIVFPQIYEKQGFRLQNDQVVLIRGRVSSREDEDAKIVANEIVLYEDIPRTAQMGVAERGKAGVPRSSAASAGGEGMSASNVASAGGAGMSTPTLWLKIPADRDIPLGEITAVLSLFPGTTRVMIFNEQTRQKFAARPEYYVTPTDELERKLQELLGSDSVKLVNA